MAPITNSPKIYPFCTVVPNSTIITLFNRFPSDFHTGKHHGKLHRTIMLAAYSVRSPFRRARYRCSAVGYQSLQYSYSQGGGPLPATTAACWMPAVDALGAMETPSSPVPLHEPSAVYTQRVLYYLLAPRGITDF